MQYVGRLHTFFDDFNDEGEGLCVNGRVAMAMQRQQDGLLQQRLKEVLG